MTGETHSSDLNAAQAKSDLLSAYNDAAGRVPTAPDFAGDQNGKTFTPGIYHTAAAFTLTGTLTLDGQGDPNAVFIFQVDAALNTAAGSTITLVNGAQAPNVFWQVLGAAGQVHHLPSPGQSCP
ncbi:antifreeze protein [Arthrobacter alpinus]|uniref:Antifreeze protein n=1 Tax=Arthrobacter alpinus TaxID=656366 RepID=A0A144IZ01_9MICC|nr:ice-binding family protein [Arthrobacter alpinus]AMT81062.1 antifreeze protein [Arthrobacter alpinus]